MTYALGFLHIVVVLIFSCVGVFFLIDLLINNWTPYDEDDHFLDEKNDFR